MSPLPGPLALWWPWQVPGHWDHVRSTLQSLESCLSPLKTATKNQALLGWLNCLSSLPRPSAPCPALLFCLCGSWLVPWHLRASPWLFHHLPRLLPGQTLLPVWRVPRGRAEDTQPLCHSLQWVSRWGWDWGEGVLSFEEGCGRLWEGRQLGGGEGANPAGWAQATEFRGSPAA